MRWHACGQSAAAPHAVGGTCGAAGRVMCEANQTPVVFILPCTLPREAAGASRIIVIEHAINYYHAEMIKCINKLLACAHVGLRRLEIALDHFSRSTELRRRRGRATSPRASAIIRTRREAISRNVIGGIGSMAAASGETLGERVDKSKGLTRLSEIGNQCKVSTRRGIFLPLSAVGENMMIMRREWRMPDMARCNARLRTGLRAWLEIMAYRARRDARVAANILKPETA